MGPKITGNLYRIENRNFLTIISFCAIGLTYIGAIDLCVLCVFVVFPIGDSETIQDIPYLYEKLCILIIS